MKGNSKNSNCSPEFVIFFVPPSANITVFWSLSLKTNLCSDIGIVCARMCMCVCVLVRVRAYALMLTQFLLVHKIYSACVLSAQHLPDDIRAVSFTTSDVVIVLLRIINQIRATTFRSTNTFHRTTALDKIRLPPRQGQYLPDFIRQRLSVAEESEQKS